MAKTFIWLLIKKNKYSNREFERPDKAIGQDSLNVNLQSFLLY